MNTKFSMRAGVHQIFLEKQVLSYWRYHSDVRDYFWQMNYDIIFLLTLYVVGSNFVHLLLDTESYEKSNSK